MYSESLNTSGSDSDIKPAESEVVIGGEVDAGRGSGRETEGGVLGDETPDGLVGRTAVDYGNVRSRGGVHRPIPAIGNSRVAVVHEKLSPPD